MNIYFYLFSYVWIKIFFFKGKIVYHNGDVYEGDWVDGLKEGRGYYTWENGDVYEGEFKNGVREGFGEFKWANGESYKGLWKEDNMAKGEVFDNFGQLFKVG